MVAPEEFWVQLWAGVNVVGASRAVGVSHWTGYRWLAEVGGPAALGLEWTGFGRPWGGRKSEEVRDVFWAELRRGAPITAASRVAGVARRTGAAWLIEAGGVRPRVKNLELEAAVTPASGRLSFIDRCRIEDLVKAGYTPARIAGLLGRHRSTITREPGRHQHWRPHSYHRTARARRVAPPKIHYHRGTRLSQLRTGRQNNPFTGPEMARFRSQSPKRSDRHDDEARRRTVRPSVA